MTLSAVEFTRRFLLHVLPRGFVRIRHYGFLSNRLRHEKLALCKRLLGDRHEGMTPSGNLGESEPEQGRGTKICQVCGAGRMIIVEQLAPECAVLVDAQPATLRIDSS
jgi:hypothetical protein